MSEINVTRREPMTDNQRERINAVLDAIPNEQYVDGYVDPKGKQGFRNPVREVVGRGLTKIVDKLQIKTGVELGTALGRSGLHFALGGLEQLDTVEFDAEAAAIAKGNFQAAGLDVFHVHNLDSGEFTRDWPYPVDMVFIDHAKERYLEDFQNLESRLTPNALVLMDNTFNRASECKDAVAYVADHYYSAIFTEPSTGGESTGLLVASKYRLVFDLALSALMDARTEAPL
jgi:predicted O-methyltransferase YrrM